MNSQGRVRILIERYFFFKVDLIYRSLLFVQNFAKKKTFVIFFKFFLSPFSKIINAIIDGLKPIFLQLYYNIFKF